MLKSGRPYQPKVTADVFRLQMRIAKAVRTGRWGKVKALQRLLVNSFSAKVLAVKRVTQNSGHKTPGVDGVVWKTAKQKLQAAKALRRRGYQPLPLKRVSIPKQDSKKLRNLHIPAMFDRTQQALHLLGLEPIAEMLADHNSYGFRPKRSAADAIGKCFILLARRSSAKWILNGDIKSCFDTIDHKWLCNNIPMDREILNKWLIAGYIEKQTFYPTEAGTAQGGLCKALHKPPRGVNFLFDKHRLNVAVSRAQCLVIVVANPNLSQITASSVGQISLVNIFCHLMQLKHTKTSKLYNPTTPITP